MSTGVDILVANQRPLYRLAMHMGGRIRVRLSELGESIAWLARASGVPLPTISIAIKRDSRRSEYSTALAVALGVTERWLTTGQGPKARLALPAAEGKQQHGGAGTHTGPSALERAQEVDGVELTKEAIQVAKAWMDLPRNRRDEFKRRIEAEALQYTSTVPDQHHEHPPVPRKRTRTPDTET